MPVSRFAARCSTVVLAMILLALPSTAAAADSDPFTADIAVQGAGWFVTAEDPAQMTGLGYHRSATLSLNAAGELVIGGQFVIGRTGTDDTRLNLSGLIDVAIDPNGTITGDHGAFRVSVGQIALVRPVNGTTTWGVPGADGFGTLAAGSLTPDPLTAIWDSGSAAPGDPSAANAAGVTVRPSRVPTAVVMDSSAFTKRGMWRSSFDAAALGGATLVSVGKTASITSRRISPAQLSLVATTCSRCGTLKVYYGKRLVKKISLRSTRTQKQVGFALPKLTRVGTITIVATGQANVDALIADRVPA